MLDGVYNLITDAVVLAEQYQDKPDLLRKAAEIADSLAKREKSSEEAIQAADSANKDIGDFFRNAENVLDKTLIRLAAITTIAMFFHSCADGRSIEKASQAADTALKHHVEQSQPAQPQQQYNMPRPRPRPIPGNEHEVSDPGPDDSPNRHARRRAKALDRKRK
jgi:hypothetical protein